MLQSSQATEFDQDFDDLAHFSLKITKNGGGQKSKVLQTPLVSCLDWSNPTQMSLSPVEHFFRFQDRDQGRF